MFSSKRRASGLAPITLAEYNQIAPKIPKKTAPITAPSKISNTTASAPKSSAFTKMETAADSKSVAKAGEEQPLESISSDVPSVQNRDELRNAALQLGLPADRIDSVVDLAAAEAGEGDDDDDAWEDVEVKANVSIFDDVEFDTVEDCVQYMELTFGFFIPDREYLTDLEGFLVYLGEKAKLGGLCIYCQKQFPPGRPCQNHMMSKSHCKVAFEEGVDLDEFEDFFDYSSTYDADAAQHFDENGNLVDDTVSEISAVTGELILPSGRTLGHREFKKYYKQRFRPEDTRESVLLQKREELLRLGAHFGGLELPSSMAGSESLQKLSDSEVMALIIKKRKEIRKNQQAEQRARQKYDFINKRSEYASTVDKLRSSATTTEKIRDWHKTC